MQHRLAHIVGPVAQQSRRDLHHGRGPPRHHCDRGDDGAPVQAAHRIQRGGEEFFRIGIPINRERNSGDKTLPRRARLEITRERRPQFRGRREFFPGGGPRRFVITVIFRCGRGVRESGGLHCLERLVKRIEFWIRNRCDGTRRRPRRAAARSRKRAGREVELIEHGVLFHSIAGIQRIEQQRAVASARREQAQRLRGDVLVCVARKRCGKRDARARVVVAARIQRVEALQDDLGRRLLELRPHRRCGREAVVEKRLDDAWLEIVLLRKFRRENLARVGFRDDADRLHGSHAHEQIHILETPDHTVLEITCLPLPDRIERRRAHAPARIVESRGEHSIHVALRADAERLGGGDDHVLIRMSHVQRNGARVLFVRSEFSEPTEHRVQDAGRLLRGTRLLFRRAIRLEKCGQFFHHACGLRHVEPREDQRHGVLPACGKCAVHRRLAHERIGRREKIGDHRQPCRTSTVQRRERDGLRLRSPEREIAREGRGLLRQRLHERDAILRGLQRSARGRLHVRARLQKCLDVRDGREAVAIQPQHRALRTVAVARDDLLGDDAEGFLRQRDCFSDGGLPLFRPRRPARERIHIRPGHGIFLPRIEAECLARRILKQVERTEADGEPLRTEQSDELRSGKRPDLLHERTHCRGVFAVSHRLHEQRPLVIRHALCAIFLDHFEREIRRARRLDGRARRSAQQHEKQQRKRSDPAPACASRIPIHDAGGKVHRRLNAAARTRRYSHSSPANSESHFRRSNSSPSRCACRSTRAANTRTRAAR